MSGYADITNNLENSRSAQTPQTILKKLTHGLKIKLNCLRRIARHDEQQFSKDSLVNVMEKFVKTVNYMDETILVPCRLMDRQVGDSTDLIPAPAKTSHHHHHHHNNHMNGGKKDRTPQTVHDFLNSADLFNLYSMLNSLKNDLLWTRNDIDEGNAEDEELAMAANNISIISTSSTSTSLVDQDNCSDTLAVPGSEQQQQQQQQQKSNILRPDSSVKGHIRRPSTASMASSNSVSNLSDSESEISNENDSGIESEGNCGGSQKGRSMSSCSSTDKATDLARQCRTHLSGLYRCLEQMTEAANYLTARYQSDVGPV